MKFIVFIGMLIPHVVFSQTPYIPRAQTLLNNGAEVKVITEYSQTDSVVDVDGEEFALEEGTSANQVDVDFLLSYGLTSGLQLDLGVKGRMTQSTFFYDDGAGDEEFSLSNSGLESSMVGFKYGFKEEQRSRFSFEGHYRFPAYSNEVYVSGKPETLALGEGSREYAFGASYYLTTKSNNIIELSSIYRSPSEDVSSELLTSLNYAINWKYFSLYGGFEYLFSFEDDAYTDDPQNKPVVFQGVSTRYNSINREWSAPFVGMNIAIGEKYRIEAKYTQVLSGVSTDLGPRVLVSLVRRSERLGNEHTRRDAEFKEYRIEGVVEKVSSSRKVVIIDKGAQDGMKKGMTVDFYFFDFVGGNELIAKGVVLKTKLNKSIIKVTRRYSKKRMEEGIVARAGLEVTR